MEQRTRYAPEGAHRCRPNRPDKPWQNGRRDLQWGVGKSCGDPAVHTQSGEALGLTNAQPEPLANRVQTKSGQGQNAAE